MVYKIIANGHITKLHKMGLAAQFDEEIQKSVAEKHIRFLTPVEEQDLLSNWHCFSGLTYSIKASSSTQKIRPCCDSSVWHTSGSLNSHLPLGTNLLNDMVHILTQFRLHVHAIAVDLHRCYRSMKSDWTGSRLRATYYPVDPTDPKCNTFRIFVYERVSYGDSLAACLLEVMMRLHIAPGCETQAGAKLIELERYVDDVLKSGLDKDELWAAILDMKSVKKL